MSNNSLALVSIIIPCYNHARYIDQALDGVIAQDYSNIELIIIDDGSKDDSANKIRTRYAECQARFVRFEFRHRPNKGLSATLNEALAWCQGKYVSFIASDDIMLTHKTSTQVRYLEQHPEFSSLSANLEFIDDNGRTLGQTTQPAQEHHFDDTLVHNALLAPSQMHILSAVRAVGGFDPQIVIEDWYLWLKLLDAGYRVMFLSEVLVQYRKHDDNMSGNLNKMYAAERQILDLYTKKPTYHQALYNLAKKEIREYRRNGQTLRYYAHKIALICKYLFIQRQKDAP